MIVKSSAPGKFVILGEHAVVYGKPAIALAMDMRFEMEAEISSKFTVNGVPASNSNVSPHMRFISEAHGNDPLAINIGERVPSGSGLGSSAALSVAYSATLRALKNLPHDNETVAHEAYEAEYFAQGRGSPMDTSASTNGGGIALNIPYKKEDFLWTVTKEKNRWDISKVHVPEMTFVIGNTGIRAPTGPLVEKVRRYKESNTFAAEIIDDIANITLDGMEALKKDDREELGRLMTKDHKYLSILGVSCPQLNKLVESTLPYSYGAKLTGSGGGGCMVALTDKPEKVAKAIKMHGGTPYIVSTGVPGVKTEIVRK